MENLKKISIEEKKLDKRINIIYKKRKKNFVLFYNSFILLLIVIFVDFISAKDKRNIINFYSEIFLVVKGNQTQRFMNFFMNEPDEVIINGISKNDSCKTSCFLEGDENNVSLIFYQEIDSCECMFCDLDNIIYIDLSNFNASKVKNMDSMFSWCINLENINFGNIDTSSVEIMSELFWNCPKLTSIDLSKLNTSNVKYMNWMFEDCINLENINFGNIDTSSVEYMNGLFNNCPKLTSIDLSNFNTSKVKNMYNMFSGCINLKYLDLSNFDFSNVYSIRNMFYNCSSLIFLNLLSLNINNTAFNNETFGYLSSYTKFCIDDEYTKYSLQQINITSDCSNLCFNTNIKLDITNNICLESCINNSYQYELNNICYHECPKDFYPKYCKDNECNTEEEYQCFGKTPEGYYLDLNNKQYKKCNNNCKFCYGEGNETLNNCVECINDLTFIDENLFKTNCFEKCPYYYYFDENNEYKCTESCQGNYNKLIEEKKKCIDICRNDDTYKHEFKNICYTYEKKLEIIKNESLDIMIRETILSYTEELLISDNKGNIDLDIQDKVQEEIKGLYLKGLNVIGVNDGNDITINVGSVNYTITTTNNQKNNNNNGVSTIYLGECENELKTEYNISKNDSLYILKADLIIEKIRKVEYEIYFPLLSNNLTQLNLSVCKDTKIDISIPFEIPIGQIDKYNRSSKLYNSICVTSTSEDGTDEPYKDRQDNYKKNNSLKVCEEDCDFIDYDFKNQKALCSCFKKLNIPAISEIKINEEKMYSNFKNIKNIANFKMLECVYLFFNKKNLIKNSSNYMMILLMTLSSVSLFSFISYNSLKIKNDINSYYFQNVLFLREQYIIN